SSASASTCRGRRCARTAIRRTSCSRRRCPRPTPDRMRPDRMHRGRMQQRGAWVLGLAASLVLAPLAHAQNALPAEALVAIGGAETPQVFTDLVLLSDVDLRARLDLGPLGLSTTPSRALQAATLDEILCEILIAREAERLRASEPSETAVRTQRDRLVATL